MDQVRQLPADHRVATTFVASFTRNPAMSQPTNSNGQYVRRVTLPSGRQIEVVYFEPLADEAARTAPAVEDLHVCPECDRDLVYPVDWEEASATHWEVELRCPNC